MLHTSQPSQAPCTPSRLNGKGSPTPLGPYGNTCYAFSPSAHTGTTMTTTTNTSYASSDMNQFEVSDYVVPTKDRRTPTQPRPLVMAHRGADGPSSNAPLTSAASRGITQNGYPLNSPNSRTHGKNHMSSRNRDAKRFSLGGKDPIDASLDIVHNRGVPISPIRGGQTPVQHATFSASHSLDTHMSSSAPWHPQAPLSSSSTYGPQGYVAPPADNMEGDVAAVQSNLNALLLLATRGDRPPPAPTPSLKSANHSRSSGTRASLCTSADHAPRRTPPAVPLCPSRPNSSGGASNQFNAVCRESAEPQPPSVRPNTVTHLRRPMSAIPTTPDVYGVKAIAERRRQREEIKGPLSTSFSSHPSMTRCCTPMDGPLVHVLVGPLSPSVPQPTSASAKQCPGAHSRRAQYEMQLTHSGQEFDEEATRLVQELDAKLETIFSLMRRLMIIECATNDRRNILRKEEEEEMAEGFSREALVEQLEVMEAAAAAAALSYVGVANRYALAWMNERQLSAALQLLRRADLLLRQGAGRLFRYVPDPVELHKERRRSSNTLLMPAVNTAVERVEEVRSLTVPIFSSMHDDVRRRAAAAVGHNLGIYHFKIGEYPVAVGRFQHTAVLEEELHAPGLAITYFNMAQAFHELPNVQEALRVMQLAENAAERDIFFAKDDAAQQRRRLIQPLACANFDFTDIDDIESRQGPTSLFSAARPVEDAPTYKGGFSQQNHSEVGPDVATAVVPEGKASLQAWMRWREAVCFMARIKETHADWLREGGRHKAASHQYELAHRWLASVPRLAPEEQQRVQSLRARIAREKLRWRREEVEHEMYGNGSPLPEEEDGGGPASTTATATRSRIFARTSTSVSQTIPVSRPRSGDSRLSGSVRADAPHKPSDVAGTATQLHAPATTPVKSVVVTTVLPHSIEVLGTHRRRASQPQAHITASLTHPYQQLNGRGEDAKQKKLSSLSSSAGVLGGPRRTRPQSQGANATLYAVYGHQLTFTPSAPPRRPESAGAAGENMDVAPAIPQLYVRKGSRMLPLQYLPAPYRGGSYRFSGHANTAPGSGNSSTQNYAPDGNDGLGAGCRWRVEEDARTTSAADQTHWERCRAEDLCDDAPQDDHAAPSAPSPHGMSNSASKSAARSLLFTPEEATPTQDSLSPDTCTHPNAVSSALPRQLTPDRVDDILDRQTSQGDAEQDVGWDADAVTAQQCLQTAIIPSLTILQCFVRASISLRICVIMAEEQRKMEEEQAVLPKNSPAKSLLDVDDTLHMVGESPATAMKRAVRPEDTTDAEAAAVSVCEPDAPNDSVYQTSSLDVYAKQTGSRESSAPEPQSFDPSAPHYVLTEASTCQTTTSLEASALDNHSASDAALPTLSAQPAASSSQRMVEDVYEGGANLRAVPRTSSGPRVDELGVKVQSSIPDCHAISDVALLKLPDGDPQHSDKQPASGAASLSGRIVPVEPSKTGVHAAASTTEPREHAGETKVTSELTGLPENGELAVARMLDSYVKGEEAAEEERMSDDAWPSIHSEEVGMADATGAVVSHLTSPLSSVLHRPTSTTGTSETHVADAAVPVVPLHSTQFFSPHEDYSLEPPSQWDVASGERMPTAQHSQNAAVHSVLRSSASSFDHRGFVSADALIGSDVDDEGQASTSSLPSTTTSSLISRRSAARGGATATSHSSPKTPNRIRSPLWMTRRSPSQARSNAVKVIGGAVEGHRRASASWKPAAREASLRSADGTTSDSTATSQPESTHRRRRPGEGSDGSVRSPQWTQRGCAEENPRSAQSSITTALTNTEEITPALLESNESRSACRTVTRCGIMATDTNVFRDTEYVMGQPQREGSLPIPYFLSAEEEVPRSGPPTSPSSVASSRPRSKKRMRMDKSTSMDLNATQAALDGTLFDMKDAPSKKGSPPTRQEAGAASGNSHTSFLPPAASVDIAPLVREPSVRGALTVNKDDLLLGSAVPFPYEGTRGVRNDEAPLDAELDANGAEDPHPAFEAGPLRDTADRVSSPVMTHASPPYYESTQPRADQDPEKRRSTTLEAILPDAGRPAQIPLRRTTPRLEELEAPEEKDEEARQASADELVGMHGQSSSRSLTAVAESAHSRSGHRRPPFSSAHRDTLSVSRNSLTSTPMRSPVEGGNVSTCLQVTRPNAVAPSYRRFPSPSDHRGTSSNANNSPRSTPLLSAAEDDLAGPFFQPTRSDGRLPSSHQSPTSSDHQHAPSCASDSHKHAATTPKAILPPQPPAVVEPLDSQMRLPCAHCIPGGVEHLTASSGVVSPSRSTALPSNESPAPAASTEEGNIVAAKPTGSPASSPQVQDPSNIVSRPSVIARRTRLFVFGPPRTATCIGVDKPHISEKDVGAVGSTQPSPCDGAHAAGHSPQGHAALHAGSSDGIAVTRTPIAGTRALETVHSSFLHLAQSHTSGSSDAPLSFPEDLESPGVAATEEDTAEQRARSLYSASANLSQLRASLWRGMHDRGDGRVDENFLRSLRSPLPGRAVTHSSPLPMSIGAASAGPAASSTTPLIPDLVIPVDENMEDKEVGAPAVEPTPEQQDASLFVGTEDVDVLQLPSLTERGTPAANDEDREQGDADEMARMSSIAASDRQAATSARDVHPKIPPFSAVQSITTEVPAPHELSNQPVAAALTAITAPALTSNSHTPVSSQSLVSSVAGSEAHHPSTPPPQPSQVETHLYEQEASIEELLRLGDAVASIMNSGTRTEEQRSSHSHSSGFRETRTTMRAVNGVYSTASSRRTVHSRTESVTREPPRALMASSETLNTRSRVDDGGTSHSRGSDVQTPLGDPHPALTQHCSVLEEEEDDEKVQRRHLRSEIVQEEAATIIQQQWRRRVMAQRWRASAALW